MITLEVRSCDLYLGVWPISFKLTHLIVPKLFKVRLSYFEYKFLMVRPCWSVKFKLTTLTLELGLLFYNLTNSKSPKQFNVDLSYWLSIFLMLRSFISHVTSDLVTLYFNLLVRKCNQANIVGIIRTFIFCTYTFYDII